MNNTKHKRQSNKYFQSALWVLVYLLIIDISVNIVFQYPKNPGKNPPSFFQGYFEYGRSVEGKLDKIKKGAERESDEILGYGWLKNKRYNSLPKKAAEGQVLIAVYGMSHTKLLGEAIETLDKKYIVRSITGPGVPPGWSYAAYDADRNQHEAKVVILGIMTDNIAYISSTSGATSYFDMSHPYTFPRYYVKEDQLKAVYPPFYTEEGLRDYLLDNEKWNSYTEWLEVNDKHYDAFLFKRSISDYSAIMRVIRRAYSQRLKESISNRIFTNKGFNTESDEFVALTRIVKNFAEDARRQERIAILYIVNNEGRGDFLYRALYPFLEANNILFLSTHEICPPDNPRVFLRTNSHFLPSKDLELGKEIIKIIAKNIG
jgi:hypothetical protein